MSRFTGFRVKTLNQKGSGEMSHGFRGTVKGFSEHFFRRSLLAKHWIFHVGLM